MTWESRKGRGRYYTRSSRSGGRVAREYYGRGEAAALTAKLDRVIRGQRESEAARLEALRAATAQFETPLAELCTLADMLARAVLLSAGFHQHARGQWRKRRRSGTQRAAGSRR